MTDLKPRGTKSRRDDILDLAEQAILEKGVSATTIEELIVEIGISKNGFFYHFQDKNKLVEAILERNLAIDEQWFSDIFQRAEETTSDPLDSMLAFLDLFAEEIENLPDIHPGCLTTACCYQERLLDDSVQVAAARLLLLWRQTLRERLEIIATKYPPKINFDLEDLAEMLPALADGAITFSRVVKDKSVLARQIRLYRLLLENVFLKDE